MQELLNIQNISVSIDKQKILDNLSCSIIANNIHIIMGPNGSGKSTLAYSILGHPRYNIEQGKLIFDGVDITQELLHKRAQRGIFLSFQQPPEIPGVQVFTFLREAARALLKKEYAVDELYDEVCKIFKFLGLAENFAYRNLNDGFSGGEKKRFELLQLLLFKPRLAILDELDSGLDADGLSLITRTIEILKQETQTTFIIISHNQHFIKRLAIDSLFVMHNGTIAAHGDHILLAAIEQQGYYGISTFR